MLYSHNLENEKFDLFMLFLNKLINGESKYKKIVDDVIEEAALLANNSKDLYDINRENYSLIVYLKSKDSDFFKSLDIKEINNDNYKKILTILEHQRPISFA